MTNLNEKIAQNRTVNHMIWLNGKRCTELAGFSCNFLEISGEKKNGHCQNKSKKKQKSKTAANKSFTFFVCHTHKMWKIA